LIPLQSDGAARASSSRQSLRRGPFVSTADRRKKPRLGRGSVARTVWNERSLQFIDVGCVAAKIEMAHSRTQNGPRPSERAPDRQSSSAIPLLVSGLAKDPGGIGRARAPARSLARCLINLLTTNAFIRLAPDRFVLREQTETVAEREGRQLQRQFTQGKCRSRTTVSKNASPVSRVLVSSSPHADADRTRENIQRPLCIRSKPRMPELCSGNRTPPHSKSARVTARKPCCASQLGLPGASQCFLRGAWRP
jgi:hypothetical protein